MYINFWYPIIRSEDLGYDQPEKAKVLGFNLVAFRDREGVAQHVRGQAVEPEHQVERVDHRRVLEGEAPDGGRRVARSTATERGNAKGSACRDQVVTCCGRAN